MCAVPWQTQLLLKVTHGTEATGVRDRDASSSVSLLSSFPSSPLIAGLPELNDFLSASELFLLRESE